MNATKKLGQALFLSATVVMTALSIAALWLTSLGSLCQTVFDIGRNSVLQNFSYILLLLVLFLVFHQLHKSKKYLITNIGLHSIPIILLLLAVHFVMFNTIFPSAKASISCISKPMTFLQLTLAMLANLCLHLLLFAKPSARKNPRVNT